MELLKEVDKSARTVQKQERHIEALESQVGLYKETLEVGSYHTVMPSPVGIGNSSFSLHCALE
ncbi:hypothetical protein P5673_033745, partial [Acropora cervicornis]